MGDLSGRVAVVTGASRGIGRAIAERLGRDGASVVVNYAGSAGKAQEVVATIEGDGSEAIAVQADMGTTADFRRLFEEATERFGSPTAGIYTASKAPIEQFTGSLAQELGGRGVTVNTVLPGLVETDGLVISEEQKEQVVAQTPLGRIGQPEDVADVVAFVASEEVRWATAQNVRAGGGLV